MTDDKQICKLAEEYVVNEYLRPGSISYAWTEKDYRSDDLDGGDVVCGECPPSDCDDYSWWQVISCEIHSSEIEERNDETREYCVEVEAWAVVDSDSNEEDADETVTPELRTIYVQIECDGAGEYCVVGVEE
ncbi:MAG TPA: hypothetical protein V6D25_25425 [Leptolyngbyaceae cyanobacterium]